MKGTNGKKEWEREKEERVESERKRERNIISKESANKH